jgi:3-oxoacyl-[acyl-carrier-protein] synthase III
MCSFCALKQLQLKNLETMKKEIYSVITGSGSYLPAVVVKNSQFMESEFYEPTGEKIAKHNEEIVQKFKEITEIEERRYIEDGHVTSDMGYFAALEAIESAKIDKESLDYIIVAHNFGDVAYGSHKVDILPTLASRIKHKLGIVNPNAVAYDLPFGCPGWLQALIQADYYIKSGDSKRILVIGAETLSRISDPYDRDSMIYADGAGAVIVEAIESSEPVGILTHKTRTDTIDHAWLLKMGTSYNPLVSNGELFIKMNGRKLYEYAITTVPQLVKETLEKAGVLLDNIKKVLIHQANAKMDEVMLAKLFRLFGKKEIPKNIMPMTIAKLGNNSVATLPVLYDLIMKGKMPEHKLESGDHFIFTSVGAGMNVNAVIYKMK